MSEDGVPAWPETPSGEALDAAIAAEDTVAVLSCLRELMAVIRTRVTIAWPGDDETLAMLDNLDSATVELIATHRAAA